MTKCGTQRNTARIDQDIFKTIKSSKKEFSGSSLIQQILPGTAGKAGVESTTDKQKKNKK